MTPPDLEKLIKLGVKYSEENNIEGFIDICRKILERSPENFEYRQVLVHYLFCKEDIAGALRELEPLKQNNLLVGWAFTLEGLCFSKLGQHENALNAFSKSLEIERTFDTVLNRGNALKHLGRLEEASQDYLAAVKLNRKSPEPWTNLGAVLIEQSKFAEALAHLDEAIKLKPNHVDALLNKANALLGLKRFEDAQNLYQELICITPKVPKLWLNVAMYFQEVGDLKGALKSIDRAIALDDKYSKAWFNRGVILERLGHSSEVEECYVKAVELNPDYEFIDGEILYSRMTNCNWEGFDGALETITRKIKEDKPVSTPFTILATIDDPELQLLAAKKWVERKRLSSQLPRVSTKKELSDRIKLGYFSADFHNHATAFLISELIESHDKSKFEVFAFSFGPQLDDQMRNRLTRAFEHFIDIRFFSDNQVADFCKDRGLNIAVDLKGYTQDSRPSLFAQNLADLHINYLGYPGTLGSSNYDYIIADRVLVPEHLQNLYSEKIMYMPGSYQCNDSHRICPELFTSREELGLSPEDFVMCCFNNVYKITPEIFDTWLNILKLLPSSVLWLLTDSEEVKKRLWARTKSFGIDPKRLLFAGRRPLAEHLSRYRCADVFLDTFPYGAHTTASEALWMGLPVVTLKGNTFASSVGASLLNVLGLGGLITLDLTQYQATVLSLFNNPEELVRVKAKLSMEHRSSCLFSGKQFAADFERGLSTAIARSAAGMPPQTFWV
jgi:predicted O-linked N-acetylglucosamine transferase (SPINDLY family)